MYEILPKFRLDGLEKWTQFWFMYFKNFVIGGIERTSPEMQFVKYESAFLGLNIIAQWIGPSPCDAIFF